MAQQLRLTHACQRQQTQRERRRRVDAVGLGLAVLVRDVHAVCLLHRIEYRAEPRQLIEHQSAPPLRRLGVTFHDRRRVPVDEPLRARRLKHGVQHGPHVVCGRRHVGQLLVYAARVRRGHVDYLAPLKRRRHVPAP